MGVFIEYVQKRNEEGKKASADAFSAYAKKQNAGARTPEISIMDNMKRRAELHEARDRSMNRARYNEAVRNYNREKYGAQKADSPYGFLEDMSMDELRGTLEKHDAGKMAKGSITGMVKAVNRSDMDSLYDKIYKNDRLDNPETRTAAVDILSDKYRKEYASLSYDELNKLINDDYRPYETKEDREYAKVLLEEIGFNEKYGSLTSKELKEILDAHADSVKKSKRTYSAPGVEDINTAYNENKESIEANLLDKDLRKRIEALYEQKKYNETHKDIYDALTDEERGLVAEIYSLRDKIKSQFGVAGDPLTMDQRKQRNEDREKLEKRISDIEKYFRQKGVSVKDMEEYFRRMANAEWMNDYNEGLRSLSEEHPVLASIYSTTMNALTPADAFTLLYYKMQGLPADPNTMLATNTRDTVRDTVSENMTGFGRFLYSTGMSMADMAMLLPLGETGTLGMFFASASTSTAKSVLERGGSTDDALKSGLAAGVAELLFEKISLDKLFNATSPATVKQFVKGTITQAGVEASEEMFTEVANTVTDLWINGGMSEYKQSVTMYRLMGMDEESARTQAAKDFGMKVLEAGAGGALSGGVFGTAAQGNALNKNRKYNNLIEQLIDGANETSSTEGTESREEIIDRLWDEMHEEKKDVSVFEPQIKYFAEDGKVELQDGSRIGVEDVQFEDNYKAVLYERASKESSSILQNAFVANYSKDSNATNEIEEKLDIVKYQANFQTIKHMAQNGRTLQDIKNELSGKMDQTAIEGIYTSVQNHMEYLAEKNVGKEQRALTSKIAKSMGFEVRYTELPEANGMTKDGVIYISTSSENPALVVLAHEATHNFKVSNAEKYAAYENYVIDYMQQYHPEEYKTTVRKLKSLYKTNDMNAIHEEIACNMTEEFLMHPDVINKICKEDRTLAEKIVDFIKTLIAKIEELYKGYSAKSVEARVLKENIDTFNEALGLWMDAMGQDREQKGDFGTKYNRRQTQEYVVNGSKYVRIKRKRKPISKDTFDNSINNELKEKLDAAFMNPSGINKRIRIMDITEELTEDIKELLDIDLTGYKIVVNSSDIIHIIGRHGKNGIADHSINDTEDISRLELLLKNYSDIEMVLDKNGKPGVCNYKDKNNEFMKMVKCYIDVYNKNYQVVLAIGENKWIKTWVKTLYATKKEASQESNANALDTTSKNDLKPASFNSIISKKVSDDNRENSEIKKSLKDFNTSIDLDREYEGISFGEAAGILGTVTEKLKRTKIDAEQIKRIAGKLVKDYYSTYSADTLAENLETMFTYLQNARDLSWREFQMLTTEVMRPVIEKTQYVDKEVKELYDSFISFLRKNPMSLSADQREDVKIQYGGITKYKQLTQGKAVISKDGTSLADYDFWKKLCEASGGYLTLDTKIIDRPGEVEDAIRHMKPLPLNNAGMNAEQMAYDMTLRTLNYYMAKQQDIEIKNAAEKIEKLQEKKAKAIKNAYEKRIKELGEQEAENLKIVKTNERIRSDERARRQKAHYDMIQEKARERKRKAALRNKIRRLKEKLDRKLVRPTDGSHIPPKLVKCTVELLDAINLDTGKGVKMAEKTKNLKDQYEEFKNDPAFAMDSDERTYENITHLYKLFDGRNITDLTEEELRWIHEIIEQLYHQIVNESKLMATEYNKSIYEAAQEVNEVIESAKRTKGKHSNFYHIQHLNPINFFRYITGYKKCVMNSVIDKLNEAQHTQMEMERQIEKIFDPVTQGKENQQELSRFVGEKKSDWVEVLGVKMPRSMRLSLVMESLNNDNIFHVAMGGITVPDYKLLKKGDTKNAYRMGTVVHLFEDEVKQYKASDDANAYELFMWQVKKQLRNIEKDLTDYDRKFLTCAKKYFHEYSGEKINETTLKLKGYKVARAHNYFPIHTDADFLQNEIDIIKYDASLNGSGFLKERRHASNPVLLEDITKVIENHRASISKYCAFAVPIRDFQKIYNVSFIGWEGSIKKTIAKKWGGDANDYIENFVADIQGARKAKHEKIEAFFQKVKNNYAGATLTTNGSVAFSQLSGYPLGAAVVGWKPIIKAMARGGKNGTPFGRAERQLIDKYTALLWYRDQGNSTQELGDLAKKKDITQKHQWLTNWLQKMDSATVGRLWYAAEYYVQDTFADLKEGTDEYYVKVASVFNEVVEKTQPNYTVMQSAALLRVPSSLWKSFFIFKTQAMTNVNMLLDTYGEWRATKTTESRQAFFRALSAQIVSGIVYGATKAAYGLAMYRIGRYWDEDKDEVTLNKIMEEIFKDVNSTFVGNFAFGEEIYAMLESLFTKEKYYGPEITFMGQISDSLSSIVNVRNVWDRYFDGKATKEDVWNKIKEVGFNITTLLGVPAENGYKLVDGIKNHVTDIMNDEFLSYNQSGKRSNYAIMYEALIRGDEERYEDIRQELIEGSSEENVNSRIKKYLAENDVRIGTAAQAKAEGNFETYEEIYQLMIGEGWNKDVVLGAINKVQDTLKVVEDMPYEKQEEVVLEAKAVSIYSYADINTALENGYTYNAQKAINDMYNTALENGKEESGARSTIKAQITKHFKEKYRNGNQEQRGQIYRFLSEIRIGKVKLYKNSDFREWLKED